ncbi:MAG: polysaccharide export protein [Acidobacteria bacterium]|nr:MAG: polysaccharide export protein [Acidobacteriota bacterium]
MRITTSRGKQIWMRLFAPVLLLAGSGCLGQAAFGQQTQRAAAPETDATTPTGQALALPGSQTDLVIGSGDLLEVSVYDAPEFDRQVRVDGAGEISLPLLGSVKIVGLTVRQSEKLLEQRFSAGQYFTNPLVSVFAKEYASQGISVLGEVHKPGIYPMLGVHTLFDVISAAGGTTPTAGNLVSITHRQAPSQPEAMKYDPSSNSYHNVQLLPGDTVVVSRAGIVYVVGDVRLPSGIVLDRPELTVLQAIAMAQGTNSTAASNNAKLIRKTTSGRQELPLPLKKIIAGKSPDWALQADDIIFVPSSAGKAAARRSLEAILQTATGVAIYHPY